MKPERNRRLRRQFWFAYWPRAWPWPRVPSIIQNTRNTMNGVSDQCHGCVECGSGHSVIGSDGGQRHTCSGQVGGAQSVTPMECCLRLVREIRMAETWSATRGPARSRRRQLLRLPEE